MQRMQDAAAEAPPKRPAPRRRGRRAAPARKVTIQRKQNNRKAQQRYREKRKAQVRSLPFTFMCMLVVCVHYSGALSAIH